MYVYKIENEKTREVYVGITNDVKKRIGQHIRESRMERSKNRKLYRSIFEYGITNFSFTILEKTENENREKYWIEQLDSYKNGLNETRDGKGNKFFDGRCIEINEKMITIAKEEYLKKGNLILASKISGIPSRKIKYILEQNGIKKSKKNFPKISKSNNFDNKSFYIIDSKTNKIIKEYDCIKSFLKVRHISLKEILSRLDENSNYIGKYIYKWKS
jgi:group I intron endonuclease